MSSKGFGRGWTRGRGSSAGAWGKGKFKGRGKGKGKFNDDHDDRVRTIKQESVVKSRRGALAARSRGRGRGGGKGGKSSDTVCYQFSRFGKCARGEGCTFKHVRVASSAVTRVDADCLFRHCEVEKAHAGSITTIVSTAQGIYTGSQDKFLKRWKPEPGPGGQFQLKADLSVALQESCCCILAQESWIFCGLWDGVIRAFSQDGKDLKLLGHSKRVNSLIIHERILISGAADQEVRLWQFDGSQSFNCTHTIKDGTPGAVHKLRVMGPYLMIGGSNGIGMCNLQSLSITKILPPVKFVSDFLEYEGHLIAAYADGTMRVFDAEGNLKKENAPSAAGNILAISGLESGPRVLCTHKGGQISTVDLPSFEPKLQFQAFDGGKVESVLCTGHEGMFLLGHQQGHLQLWQRREGVMLPPQIG